MGANGFKGIKKGIRVYAVPLVFRDFQLNTLELKVLDFATIWDGF